MAQVICTSKHAQFQPLLGGVRFFNSEVGRISEEITDEQTAEFLKTPTHFRLHTGDPVEEVKKAAKKAAGGAAARGASAPAGGADSSQSQHPGF
jgi:hypothetical protein